MFVFTVVLRIPSDFHGNSNVDELLFIVGYCFCLFSHSHKNIWLSTAYISDMNVSTSLKEIPRWYNSKVKNYFIKQLVFILGRKYEFPRI